jgi:hypothetical protein
MNTFPTDNRSTAGHAGKNNWIQTKQLDSGLFGKAGA